MFSFISHDVLCHQISPFSPPFLIGGQYACGWVSRITLSRLAAGFAVSLASSPGRRRLIPLPPTCPRLIPSGATTRYQHHRNPPLTSAQRVLSGKASHRFYPASPPPPPLVLVSPPPSSAPRRPPRGSGRFIPRMPS